MEIFLQSETWIAILTLTFLEIVLGVDNIIFISIVANKLPQDQQKQARFIGLTMALVFRVGLLLGISYIIGLTKPLFTILDLEVSGRDLILAVGGIFLIGKSTTEIHHKVEGEEHEQMGKSASVTLRGVIIQIILLDIIFSFDSILTAVGLTEHVILMIIAVVLAMIVMMVFAGKIAAFISNHPTLEILALSFLILIGFMLILEAAHLHVPKGYIYFAVFFALGIELVNMRMRKNKVPIKLRKRIKE